MDYPNRPVQPVDTPNNISLATTILGFLSLIPKIQSINKNFLLIISLSVRLLHFIGLAYFYGYSLLYLIFILHTVY
jgi:hypothetical protein